MDVCTAGMPGPLQVFLERWRGSVLGQRAPAATGSFCEQKSTTYSVICCYCLLGSERFKYLASCQLVENLAFGRLVMNGNEPFFQISDLSDPFCVFE